MYGKMNLDITPKVITPRHNDELEIMIVDDNPKNLKVLSEILKKESYRVRTMNNGKLALRSLAMKSVDLILLDINMPDLNGYEVTSIIKSNEHLKDIPIILITALTSVENKLKGFELGAVDYITKPLILEEVQARVSTHLKLREATRILHLKNSNLESLVNKKVTEITSAHLTTVFAMVELAESRDDDTGSHVKRIGEFCKKISELACEIDYDNLIDDEFIHNIYIASPLHDIGKIGIRDAILLKPGKLTVDEFEEMKKHVVIGADRLDAIGNVTPSNAFIKMGASIARYHHEKWNGKGYAIGLKGKEIPIEARIMAIADVYDALRSKRIYKEAFSHEEATKIMLQGKGEHFDPKLLELFIDNVEWFNLTYNELSGKNI